MLMGSSVDTSVALLYSPLLTHARVVEVIFKPSNAIAGRLGSNLPFDRRRLSTLFPVVDCAIISMALLLARFKEGQDFRSVDSFIMQCD